MNDILKINKNLGIKHNVLFRVIDQDTGKVVQTHQGHNAATDSLLYGIAHYLIGDGVLNQGPYMLSNYIPRYISLGTMGLESQEQDSKFLPTGIGGKSTEAKATRYKRYLQQCPGYGADGYDVNTNNGRPYFGLGQTFVKGQSTINCELISSTFPRQPISYREVIPETHSEIPKTIDVVFSAMISTGALSQFREPGKDYIFITEAGLWSKQEYIESGGDNGLLAGYRIIPPNQNNLDMTVESNQTLLEKSILRVGINQVVQVIWKIQLGAVEELGSKYDDIMK